MLLHVCNAVIRVLKIVLNVRDDEGRAEDDCSVGARYGRLVLVKQQQALQARALIPSRSPLLCSALCGGQVISDRRADDSQNVVDRQNIFGSGVSGGEFIKLRFDADKTFPGIFENPAFLVGDQSAPADRDDRRDR